MDRQRNDWNGLPDAGIARWVPARKAAVVAALRAGRVTREAACARWNLTAQEIALWQAALDQAGVAGLRVTRIQLYRRRAA